MAQGNGTAAAGDLYRLDDLAVHAVGDFDLLVLTVELREPGHLIGTMRVLQENRVRVTGSHGDGALVGQA